MANSVDPDQTAPVGAVCSGSMLVASILNSSVMLGNYLQQTTSADDIFRCIFNVVFNYVIYVVFNSSYTNELDTMSLGWFILHFKGSRVIISKLYI